MNKRLSIAIIGSRGYPYVYSGYETLVKELSERLVCSGHTVTVYCHRALFQKKPKSVNGINLIYTPSIETKFLSQIINSFFSFIHVCFSKSDVVLVVNSANGPFGLFTRIFRKKTCINVDGLEWLRPKWKGLGSLYFKIASKLSTIFFDEIITDSIKMNRIYIKKFKKNSTVIAYGPNLNKTFNQKILKKYNLVSGEYYLIVGRLIPDNNSKLIIEGFLNSKSKKKLIVVGDVPYDDIYANKVKSFSSDNIIFPGYIKDIQYLSCLYYNCFAYIHGHEYGGTNPTMINALSINLNILSLNTIFNKEMLKGKKAIYFEKDNSSISTSINLFEKKYQQITKLNSEYIMPVSYDWDLITKRYIQIFLKLTNSQNM